jgi:hypothetical protein
MQRDTIVKGTSYFFRFVEGGDRGFVAVFTRD